MRAPGERAVLSPYDAGPDRVVEQGDYIRTTTGRTYLVEAVHHVRSAVVGRLRLTTTVMPADHEPEPDAVVHPLHWYSRNPQRGAS